MITHKTLTLDNYSRHVIFLIKLYTKKHLNNSCTEYIMAHKT